MGQMLPLMVAPKYLSLQLKEGLPLEGILLSKSTLENLDQSPKH